MAQFIPGYQHSPNTQGLHIGQISLLLLLSLLTLSQLDNTADSTGCVCVYVESMVNIIPKFNLF